MDIYKTVKSMYPNSIINLSGHSLGGAIASTIAVYNDDNNIAVTFGSPPGLRYVKRFMDPQNITNIYNYGSNNDPIFQGTCNGPVSTCYYGGYLIETKCQLGYKCTYTSSGYENIRHHRIENMIKDMEKLPTVPLCQNDQSLCKDCTDWTFVE
jgi:lipase ATG15